MSTGSEHFWPTGSGHQFHLIERTLEETRIGPTPPAGLVSVIVFCAGQLEYTRLCVPSLLRHSRAPYELIFLDVGSLDGTAEYLAGVQAAASVRVEVVRCADDADVPAECQQALSKARGEFIALLNNNVIVTESWLNQLVALVSMNPVVGMVGPMSNYAPPAQCVDAVPYRIHRRKDWPIAADEDGSLVFVDLEAVDVFARSHREKHRGQWFEAEELAGFCLLVKRPVLQPIGAFDQPTGLGFFDASVLSRGVLHAGFRLAGCRDLFVHHFGSRLIGAAKQ